MRKPTDRPPLEIVTGCPVKVVSLPKLTYRKGLYPQDFLGRTGMVRSIIEELDNGRKVAYLRFDGDNYYSFFPIEGLIRTGRKRRALRRTRRRTRRR